MTIQNGEYLDHLVNDLIEREGAYVDHPSDRGGPTRWGITEDVARASGYEGAMADLPKAFAAKVYKSRYFYRPRFDLIAEFSESVAKELLDSGVNFGPSVPSVWLQRWLNGFNRQGQDYDDLRVDGAIGPRTANAFAAFLHRRGRPGERVMVVALNCSQGVRYLELAEGRPANEDFLYGWLAQRVAAQLNKGA